jgi:hypothetical protein
MSHADLPPSVLWRNRQIETHLVLRPKPRNHRDPNHHTRATGFEAKPEKIVATGFEAKPEKTVATGFEAKLLETVTTGFEAKPVKAV